MTSFPKTRAMLTTMLLGQMLLATASAAGERYFLTDQEALLYKVINWWYHAEPDEAAGVCGTVVRVASDAPSTVSHDPTAMKTVFTFSNFAELLSPGQNILRGRTVDGKGVWETEISEDAIGNRLLVTHLAETETQLMQEGLFVELQGTILGLRDGRVALYTAEDNLYTCPPRPSAAPTQLRILDQGSQKPFIVVVLSDQIR